MHHLDPITAGYGLVIVLAVLALLFGRSKPAASLRIVSTLKGPLVTAPTGSNRHFKLQAADSSGAQGATLTGTPSWSSSDTAVLTVAADADGLGATASFLKVGTASVQANATSSDGTPLSASFAITVTAGPAVSIAIVDDQPANS